ncbi:unnamed protein product [Linum trigynum]|uniref:Uncharacterized protein n=1 Tax=Linum trigynum TaxID=586398 RepID=A0AAV2D1D3_9ROSI
MSEEPTVYEAEWAIDHDPGCVCRRLRDGFLDDFGVGKDAPPRFVDSAVRQAAEGVGSLDRIWVVSSSGNPSYLMFPYPYHQSPQSAFCFSLMESEE